MTNSSLSQNSEYDASRAGAVTAIAMVAVLSAAMWSKSLPVHIVVSTAAWLTVLPVMYWFIQLKEGRSREEVFSVLDQSWSLYACWVLLLPAYIITVSQWIMRPNDLPSWAWQGRWFFIAAGVGLFLAWLFECADRSRYSSESLNEPAKRYFNDVIVSFVLVLLVARAAPVLFAPWNGWTWTAIALILGWIVLMGVDGLRYFAGLPAWAPAWAERWYQKCRLIPEKQHPPYDIDAKKLM